MPDLATNILGEAVHMPVIIAPTGFNGMLWPQGDLALAKAAQAAGIPFTLSTVSNYDLIADEQALEPAGVVPVVSVQGNRTPSIGWSIAPQAAGCDKLVVTTDVPALGAREWDQRNYTRPLKLSPASVLNVLGHPRWLWEVMVPNGAPEFANLAEFLPPGARSALQGVRFMGTQINPSLSWEDIDRIRARWRGKLVLKGILCVDDALRAVDAGADGIVLSNHGGRQLDTAVTGIEIVAQVAAAVGEQLTRARRRRFPARLGCVEGARSRGRRGHARTRTLVWARGRRRSWRRPRTAPAAGRDGTRHDTARVPFASANSVRT